MFDGVAERYDLTNTVISMGQDRYWRWATRKALALRPGKRVLDLAAGTGVSTVEFAKSGAWCVAACATALRSAPLPGQPGRTIPPCACGTRLESGVWATTQSSPVGFPRQEFLKRLSERSPQLGQGR